MLEKRRNVWTLYIDVCISHWHRKQNQTQPLRPLWTNSLACLEIPLSVFKPNKDSGFCIAVKHRLQHLFKIFLLTMQRKFLRVNLACLFIVQSMLANRCISCDTYQYHFPPKFHMRGNHSFNNQSFLEWNCQLHAIIRELKRPVRFSFER